MKDRQTLGAVSRRLQRSSLLVGAVIASLIAAIGVPSADAAAKFPTTRVGTELNLYNWSNYIDPALLTRFTAETGIKVNLGVYDSNAAMLAKLEAGARGYDIIVPTDYMVQIMKAKKLLVRLNGSSFPNAVNLKSAFRNPYFDMNRWYTIPYLHGTTGFAYLKDKVSPAPTSWKEFFAALPNYAGKTTLFDDKKEVIDAALRATGSVPCTSSAIKLQKALDLLKSIKSSLNTLSSSGNIGRLSSGTSVLLMMYNGATYRAALANSNVVYVYPSDGMPLWQDNFAIPVGAKNLVNAKIFLNWMMDPKNAAQASIYAGYNSAIAGSDAYLSAAMKADPAINPTAEQLSKAIAMAPCSSAVNDLYSKVWVSFKG
jgi:spermidine/putrescine transport system substrate-binding protein